MSDCTCETIITTYKCDDSYGGRSIGEMASVNLAPFAALTGGEIVEPEELLFLDTETTGLSGGSGTVAFLVGVGHFTADGGFVIKQYLMRDYDEEYPLLLCTDAELRARETLVTYNGKAFDMNLLASRFIMNGMRMRQPENHLDLLYFARRLWRNCLYNCRLTTLERELLSEFREDDIPGSMIPQVYFNYLHNGDPRLIYKIMEHNRADILAMAAVMHYLCSRMNDPEMVCVGGQHGKYGLGKYGHHELMGLASIFEKMEEKKKAERCYRLSVESGNPAAIRSALQGLAQMKKRDREYEEAVACWERMLDFTPQVGVYPYVELAKYYEHRRRDYKTACAYTEQAMIVANRMRFAGEDLMRQLTARQQRLNRKLDRDSRATEANNTVGEFPNKL